MNGAMARSKRIDLPFTLYHVISRTNSDEISFSDDTDYRKFLHYLDQYAVLFSFRIHAWCVMPNHFHLLMESAHQPALSELMRRLLTAYTVYFNRRHRRHGHLFQGRFKSFVVDKAPYLLSLSRYIHTNPSGGKKTRDLLSYKWSSLPYYIMGGEPRMLRTKEVLDWFQGNRKKYARFVLKGLDEETKPVVMSQRYVGSRAFVQRMNKKLLQLVDPGTRAKRAKEKADQQIKEGQEQIAQEIMDLVSRHFFCSPGRIREVRYGGGGLRKARTIAICLLRESLPWSYREIADYMNSKDQSVVLYHQKCLRDSKDLQGHFESIQKQLLGGKISRFSVV